jgi:anti-sigma factor RsiW
MTQPPLPYYPAPAGLRERVQAAIRRPARRGPPRQLLWTVGIAATLLVSIGTWSFGAAGRANDAELQMVLDGHLRSLAPGHLTDVTSTDQHTVKPWFAGKLDFSPPVIDPASAGYPLVGGRVDVVAGLPTAALVYSRRSHIINLFIRPTERGGTVPARESIRRGYNILKWAGAGMQFWAVSDLNLEELREFQRLVAPPTS